MQANNIFFSQAPVPKLESNSLSRNQNKSPSKVNFSNTLQEANSSMKQENNEKQTEGTNKDSSKVNQQDGKGGQQAKKDSWAKRNVVSKVEEDLPEAPTNPQDILELTQWVNGLPVILTSNLPEVQQVNDEPAAHLTTTFFAALTSIEENSANLPTEEQLNKHLNVKSNEMIQPVQNNLVLATKGVVNTVEDQLVQKDLLFSTSQTGTDIPQNSNAVVDQITKNISQQDNQMVESVDVSMEQVKTASLAPQANSLLVNQAVEEIESGKAVVEDNQKIKQDGLKDFWQNLKEKLEVSQTKGTMVELAGQQPQQQNKNAGEENSFSQGISLIDHSIKATAEKGTANDFQHIMKNLDKNEVIQQVIQKVQVNLKPGQTEMRMNLKPEHLGQLQMKLVVEDGKVTAQFLTNNQSVKETLENNLSQLRQSLQDQGIRIEKLSVLIGGGNLHFNQGRKEESFTGHQRQGKSWRKVSSDSYDEKMIESISSIQKQVVSDGGVDYMA